MVYVITNKELGVYLGNFIGLGFWSKLDSAGQTHATVFENVEQAKDHVRSWDNHNDPADYGFHEVATQEHGASIDLLKEAGLGHLLGDMENNLDDAPPHGMK